MKKHFSLFILLFCCLPLFAQTTDDLWLQPSDDRQRGCEYVPNEVLVKFRSAAPMKIRHRKAGAAYMSAGISAIDAVLDSIGVVSAENLMPHTGAMVSKKPAYIRGKRLAPDANLTNLYRLQLDSTKSLSVDEAVARLEQLSEVDYAEPNYVLHIMASPDTIYNHNDHTTYSAEPLYSQQYGIKAVNLPWLWQQPKSKKRPVIAIIDTGVDIEHPDLKDNIWTNTAEAEGVGGQDDDGNGYFDDLHGYDFINNTGIISDFNGHGTHCAGIAAAVGNNGIGITGANPDALIMPIQVMDKTGSGDVGTMIKGIDYAVANGADVLSMSIGGCGYSAAEEEALLKAYYAGKYIVAAAGNEACDIYSASTICGYHHVFPAAFKFVYGVMATDMLGHRALFSNYDSDGPIFSEYDPAGPTFFGDYYNYELSAPGVAIMSTFPNGSYRAMSGTSMATPLVAGALSRLLQCRTFSSQENAMGLLIQTCNETTHNIDMRAAMEFDELAVDPVLVVTHYTIVDTIFGGNGDGKANPGEYLEIYPTIQCVYGQAKGVSVRINQGLNVDTTTLTVIKNDARVGVNLSPGATLRCKEPIIVKVAERCGDGYTIQLYPTISTDSTPTINMANAYAHKLNINIEGYATYLRGIQTDSVTLYPGIKYIIDQNYALDKEAVLRILPGSTIYRGSNAIFNAQNGHVIAHGKPDSMIVFKGVPSNSYDHGYLIFAGTDTIKYMLYDGETTYGGYNLFRHICLENCIIKNIHMATNAYDGISLSSRWLYCNIIKNKMSTFGGTSGNDIYKKCNIVNNETRIGVWSMEFNRGHTCIPYSCNIINNVSCESDRKGMLTIAYAGSDAGIRRFSMEQPSYFGDYPENVLMEGIYDIHNGHGFAELDISNRLTRPVREAHGMIWKIAIDGEECQYDYWQQTPVGVGKHTVSVYFNRAMDTAANPIISYGVRKPYTQHSVADNPTWSADSTIFSVDFTITARTMSDGLNRVSISGGRDDEHFDCIPDSSRFNIIIQAAGSLSTGLMAEPGLGKVHLTWQTDEEDYADLLGYDIYRWTDYKDSVYINSHYEDGKYVNGYWKYLYDTIVVNDRTLLPEAVEFTDYDVTPGTAYYYQIRQVTTSFSQYNLSNPVSCIPLTASKGDANGSLSVDIADVVTEISYLTGGNPQPFIFEAADVNGDSIINILDVVGTINIIVHPETSSQGFSDSNTAVFTIEDGILYVETPVVLGGVQFTLAANREDAAISPMEALQGFEQVGTWSDNDTYTFLAYSMSGKTLSVGKHALLRIGDASVENIVLSNPRGQNVPAILGSATAISVAEAMQMRTAYPNPFTTEATIPYIIGQTGTHDVRFVFTNVAGLVIDTYTAQQSFGEYTYTWRPDVALPAGVYFVTLYVDDKALQVAKLIRAVK